MVRMGKVDRRALLWLGCMMGLWSPLLWAEVKVIPVFEAQAAVQTLKEIYPQLGVSAMGNQLVLSGTPAQLQEAEATLAQINQPPQSLLIEWRVDGAASGQQLGAQSVATRPSGSGWSMATPSSTSAARTTAGRCAGCRAVPCCCRWAPISRSPSISGTGAPWWG